MWKTIGCQDRLGTNLRKVEKGEVCSPQADWQSYKGHEYFPQPGDVFMQVGDDGGGFHVKGGGWTFAGPAVPKNGATGGVAGSGDEPNGDECAGWSEGRSDAIDLLSGMMQLVVAAVKDYGQ